MFFSNARRFVACAALAMGFVQAASAAEVLIADAKSQPESLTVAPGGVLIVGSASSPFVYRVRPGSSTAEKFIDASAEGPGTFFFGMLADEYEQKQSRSHAHVLGLLGEGFGRSWSRGMFVREMP